MKVAIYIRVSRIDLNPENQKLELEKFARGMGWDYEIFEEKESTRKTRPIKKELFDRACKKEFDGILVYKLDRWARSLQELLNDLTILQNNKVEFRSLGESITINQDPRNMLMVHMLGAFAEFERAMIRERTMIGLARARAEGRIGGRPRKDRKNPFIDPSPEEVIELRLQNRTVREIAAMLDTSKNRVEKVLKKIPSLQLEVKNKEKEVMSYTGVFNNEKEKDEQRNNG